MGLSEQMRIVLTGDTSKYERSMQHTRTQTQQTTQYVERTWTDMANRIVKVLGGITVGYGVKQIASSFLEVGFSVDRISRSMEAATGSARESAAAQAFLRGESERLGVVYRDQIQDYQKLAAAARGTNLEGAATRDIYLGIAEASTALQLSTDQTSGAINAVTQMISKGKVQAEELRGQLGERLPGAFQIAAKAMGTTTAGLSEMLERGEVYSDVFLPRFAQALRERFAGSIESASQSATASLNRIHNTWFDLQKAVMESGVMAEIGLQLKNVGDEMKFWLEQNRELIKQKVPQYIEETKAALVKIWDVISYDPAILEWGLVGLALGGKKGAVITGGMAHMASWAGNLGKALGMASAGVLDFKEIAAANFKELEALVQKGESLMQGPYYRGKIIRPTTIVEPVTMTKIAPVAAPFDEKAFKAKMTGLDDEAKIYLKSFDDYREWELKWYSDRQKMAEKDADRERKAAEQTIREQEKLAGDRLNAYRDMYSDLGDLSEKNYDFQRELLYKQYDEFVRITGDYALAAEWLARKEKDLLRERTLRHGGFFAGIRQGFEDMEKDTKSWAQRSHDIVMEMAATSKNTLSDVLFDGITGDLKTFADYWDTIWKSMLRSTTNQIADFAIDAGASIGKELLGSAGSAIGSFAGDAIDWLFGAQGIWSIPRRGDEVPVIAHEGEMIIPKTTADILRSMYGDFAGMVGGANLGKSAVSGTYYEGSFGIEGAKGGAYASNLVAAAVKAAVMGFMSPRANINAVSALYDALTAPNVADLVGAWGYSGFGGYEGMSGFGGYEGLGSGFGGEFFGSYARGTGPRGLPKTGLFLGHQGEIVLNPSQSEMLRRASTRETGFSSTINLNIENMSGDQQSINTLVKEIDYRLTKIWKRRTN